MRAAALVAVIALTLAGCAGLGPEKAPVCDGKHRRPANLYGSVLDPAAPPTAAADKLSALPATQGSCA